MTQPFPADLRILRSVATATGAGDSLEAINTNLLMDRALVSVASNNQIYMLRKDSAAAPSGDAVVAPVIGPGRFFKYSSGAAGAGSILDLSVNAAGVDVIPGGQAVMRTGSRTNAAGAYNGGGTGNKSLLGVLNYDIPIADLASISFVWTSQLGLGGPFYIPPTAGTVLSPYVNLLVDFNPSPGPGDLRVLALLDDSAAPPITAVIGTFFNDGFNVLTYSWTSAQDVLIVNSPPNAVPGGVAPNVSVGPAWPNNSYKWSALVAANPNARLVTMFPANPLLFPLGDGGLPAGAVVPSILLVSGDSANLLKSGKTLHQIQVNGQTIQL